MTELDLTFGDYSAGSKNIEPSGIYNIGMKWMTKKSLSEDRMGEFRKRLSSKL